MQRNNDSLVYEDDAIIYANNHRYVTVDNDREDTLVFTIKHPVQPSPCDWSEWQKADYILTETMDKFTLLNGGDPKSKKSSVPDKAPELRFKVVK